MLGIPVIVNVDGIEWERAKWGRFARHIFRIGAHLTAMFANSLIVDAKAIGDYWATHFKRDSIYIPYGGVPSADQLPTPLDLTQFGYVVVVARLVPENSIPEFLEAAPEIAKSYPVVLVGSSGYGGELETRAQALADSNPNFHWIGHVQDDHLLHALWQNARVYFHGHTVGGTNPALVQAMTLGVPTIAVETRYNREVLGNLGRFCDGTAVGITKGIHDSWKFEEPSLRSDLMLRASECFSWPSVSRAYSRQLRNLVYCDRSESNA